MPIPARIRIPDRLQKASEDIHIRVTPNQREAVLNGSKDGNISRFVRELIDSVVRAEKPEGKQ